MSDFDVVVVGGGYAGMTAADRILKSDPERRVALIDAKPAFVERIRLHEIAAGSSPGHYPYDTKLQELGGTFIQGAVKSIQADHSTLTVRVADGALRDISYRYLVLAVGSFTNRDMVPGIAENAICLDRVDEVQALAAWGAEGVGKLTVVGGGLTAIETATEFAERYSKLEVTLVSSGALSASNEPGGYSSAGVKHLRDVIDRLGIRFVENTRVAALEARTAHLSNGERIGFDRCVWAAGLLVSDIGRRAGLATNPDGRIICNEMLQSVSHPNIIAIGDIAEVHSKPGGLCRMSCAAGRPMGEGAAATVVSLLQGNPPPPFQFGYVFRCVSLGREDGLIQFVDLQDRPMDQVWTGERAARWKEYVCRRTVAGVGMADDLPPPDTPPVAVTSQQALMHLGEA